MVSKRVARLTFTGQDKPIAALTQGTTYVTVLTVVNATAKPTKSTWSEAHLVHVDLVGLAAALATVNTSTHVMPSMRAAMSLSLYNSLNVPVQTRV